MSAFCLLILLLGGKVEARRADPATTIGIDPSAYFNSRDPTIRLLSKRTCPLLVANNEFDLRHKHSGGPDSTATTGSSAQDRTDDRVPAPISGQPVLATEGVRPLELTEFTVRLSLGGAQLVWITTAEHAIASFAVEISPDGSTFHDLARVAGHGNQSGPHSYHFNDGALASYTTPLVYYRLRQVDQDSTTRFSPVRVLAISNYPDGLLEVWPTYVTASTAISIAGVADGQLIQLQDLRGRILLSIQQLHRSPRLLIFPSALQAGIYVVSSGSQTRRIVVE